MSMTQKLAALFGIIFLGAGVVIGVSQMNRNSDEEIDPEKTLVYASFYPIEHFASIVGGETVQVINATPAGADPHDFEPSPRDITRMMEADLFIYNGKGFEPWTDEIFAELESAGVTILNISENIDESLFLEWEEHEDHDDEDHHDLDIDSEVIEHLSLEYHEDENKLKYSGEILLPTPCHNFSIDFEYEEDELRMNIEIISPEEDVICVQMIDEREFFGEYELTREIEDFALLLSGEVIFSEELEHLEKDHDDHAQNYIEIPYEELDLSYVVRDFSLEYHEDEGELKYSFRLDLSNSCIPEEQSLAEILLEYQEDVLRVNINSNNLEEFNNCGFQEFSGEYIIEEGVEVQDVMIFFDEKLALSDELNHFGDDQHDEESSHGHEHGEYDPHLWLNPLYAAEYMRIIEDTLSEISPEDKDLFQENSGKYISELRALDQKFSSSLSFCELSTAIVSHDAFNYLGDRYGISFISVHGISPEEDPTPRDIAEIMEYVEEFNLSHILLEQFAYSGQSASIAQDTGVGVLPIHSLESLLDSERSSGETYISLMEKNLESLSVVLRC